MSHDPLRIDDKFVEEVNQGDGVEIQSRRVIDHLLGGKVARRTVEDLGEAVGRAKQNRAAGDFAKRG